MYVPSLISIPFVLSKIWPGKPIIMKIWLKGDNHQYNYEMAPSIYNIFKDERDATWTEQN